MSWVLFLNFFTIRKDMFLGVMDEVLRVFRIINSNFFAIG